MDNKALLALAERAEAATAPDRELDFAILCEVDFRARQTGALPGDPRYTASLDAAMMLVPEGWDQRFEEISGKVNWKLQRGAIVVSSDAATPALALTAACCRALATSEPE